MPLEGVAASPKNRSRTSEGNQGVVRAGRREAHNICPGAAGCLPSAPSSNVRFREDSCINGPERVKGMPGSLGGQTKCPRVGIYACGYVD